MLGLCDRITSRNNPKAWPDFTVLIFTYVLKHFKFYNGGLFHVAKFQGKMAPLIGIVFASGAGRNYQWACN